MKFKYKARKAGKENVIEGEAESKDRFSLSSEMRDKGLILVSVSEVANKWHDLGRLNEMVVSVSLHDKVVFANNLSAMISAGLSLSRALDVLGRQTKNVKFKRAIEEILKDVNSGLALSVSLAKFPKIFSPVFIAMVAAGEESGNLPQSLKLVGDQMEKTYALRRKVKGAMAYPAVIVFAMGVIGALMLTFVVPNLVQTFKEMKVELPFSTKIIIGFSNILVNDWFYTLIALVASVAAFYFAIRTKRGARSLDFVVLHLPVFSGVVKQLNAATAARTLSSLIVSGVSIVEALEITVKVLQNSFYKDVLVKAKEGVEKGEPLSKFFEQEEKLFPILVGELTEVGEETGKLSEMLSNVAVFYENEVEAVTKDLSTIIEPILMVAIGLFVGFFAVSMIQPIYSITEAI